MEEKITVTNGKLMNVKRNKLFNYKSRDNSIVKINFELLNKILNKN